MRKKKWEARRKRRFNRWLEGELQEKRSPQRLDKFLYLAGSKFIRTMKVKD